MYIYACGALKLIYKLRYAIFDADARARRSGSVGLFHFQSFGTLEVAVSYQVDQNLTSRFGIYYLLLILLINTTIIYSFPKNMRLKRPL